MKDNRRRRRALFFIVAALGHAAAIGLIAWSVEVQHTKAEEVAEVMKLVDVSERPPPPPPPEAAPVQTISEAIAENLVETETVPDIVVASAPAAPPRPPAEEYVSQSKVSKMPRFDEKAILSKLVYPPIAQRSGIEEGRVVLELFVNKQGQVTRINILKEDPENRGFGEAAVRAFTGATAIPAEANGEVVAVRIRYPVRFQLK